MGILTSLNNEIWKEKACIEDLTKEFVMHVQENRLEEAAQLGRDLMKSIAYIQQLERRKRLYVTALKFNGKVVNRYANQG